MLEQIIEYLQNCPLLGSALGQDFLSQDDGAAGVQLLSCEPILQQYADGGSLRQAMFRMTRKRHLTGWRSGSRLSPS